MRRLSKELRAREIWDRGIGWRHYGGVPRVVHWPNNTRKRCGWVGKAHKWVEKAQLWDPSNKNAQDSRHGVESTRQTIEPNKTTKRHPPWGREVLDCGSQTPP
jgi:hypothetical protein